MTLADTFLNLDKEQKHVNQQNNPRWVFLGRKSNYIIMITFPHLNNTR